MVDSEIKLGKEKVLDWLKEENFLPEEIQSAQYYWLFSANVFGTTLYVGHNTRNLKCLVVFGVWNMGERELNLLNKDMDEKKRSDFVWETNLYYLSNNALSYGILKPNPPNDIRTLEIASQRIYYETLFKEKLIHSMYDVRNAAQIFYFLLNRHAGSFIPKQDEKGQSFIR